jgi:hypothetical protein
MLLVKGEKQELQCKRCGQAFECNVHNINECQCSALALSSETRDFLAKAFWECLCFNCLIEIDQKIKSIQAKSFPCTKELKEGVHYYLVNGLWVFTEMYHMLRGDCCKSGCRHCAYGYKKVKV